MLFRSAIIIENVNPDSLAASLAVPASDLQKDGVTILQGGKYSALVDYRHGDLPGMYEMARSLYADRISPKLKTDVPAID